jgi:allophanate hydrolase
MKAVPADLSIAALRKAYAEGHAPAEVMARVLHRIAACQRRGVWIHVMTQPEIAAQLRALEQARAAGKTLPLYGIPFAVKDNIDVAGVPTTAACPAYSYVPKVSATCVQRLVEAGAIVVGKTNMDQFATGLVGTRSPYGVCENAFDPTYISGGSSSGSAVAVAGGLCSFSLGTDTAGSGRVPAAFNHIVGLKPTRGLISAAGMVPACQSLDCVSVFALNCADAEAVLEVAAGPDAADNLSRVAPKMERRQHGALRVGIPDHLEFFGNHDASALFRQAVARVEAMGAEVMPVSFTPFSQAGDLLYNGAWVAERLLTAGKLLVEKPEALQPELRAILHGAQSLTAMEAFEGMHKLAGYKRRVEEQFTMIDVLLAPTTGTIYTIAEIQHDPIRRNRNLGHYTMFVNLLDLCAVAVPGGFLSNGLPWGVTFMAPAFQEWKLLPLAAKFHEGILSEITK